ncbi:MAG: hypothetical protein QT12_C0034G0008 [archaeon GW2011_AR21]|nr:MAG: hypothetical protein QT12_C0034G0008 [archaeon GW2011_AR21]
MIINNLNHYFFMASFRSLGKALVWAARNPRKALMVPLIVAGMSLAVPKSIAQVLPAYLTEGAKVESDSVEFKRITIKKGDSLIIPESVIVNLQERLGNNKLTFSIEREKTETYLRRRLQSNKEILRAKIAAEILKANQDKFVITGAIARDVEGETVLFVKNQKTGKEEKVRLPAKDFNPRTLIGLSVRYPLGQVGKFPLSGRTSLDLKHFESRPGANLDYYLAHDFSIGNNPKLIATLGLEDTAGRKTYGLKGTLSWAAKGWVFEPAVGIAKRQEFQGLPSERGIGAGVFAKKTTGKLSGLRLTVDYVRWGSKGDAPDQKVFLTKVILPLSRRGAGGNAAQSTAVEQRVLKPWQPKEEPRWLKALWTPFKPIERIVGQGKKPQTREVRKPRARR